MSVVIKSHTLRSGVTVARLALNQLVKVQILAPQLKKQGSLDRNRLTVDESVDGEPLPVANKGK